MTRETLKLILRIIAAIVSALQGVFGCIRRNRH